MAGLSGFDETGMATWWSSAMRVTGCACAAFLLVGCAVGPDFHKPDAPDAKAYDTDALPAQTASVPVTGGEAQRFESGADIPDDWWTLFQSPALNALIERALKNNPDLVASACKGACVESSTPSVNDLAPVTPSGSDSTQQIAGFA